MKKIIVFLSTTLSTLINAQDDVMSDVGMSTGWKEKGIAYWQALSSIHKCLFAGLVALAIVWVICRLVTCGKGRCGCNCGGQCSCKK